MAKTVTRKQTKWQQEGTHGDHSTFYVPIKRGNIKRLGSVRQTWATSMNNQLTQEVQRASKGLYVKLPSITKIAWVTRATIYNKVCSLGPDAQVRVRLEPAHRPTKQEDSNTTRTGNDQKQADQKKAGEMPHTLYKSRKIQQNNPKINKCRETTPQQLSPDKKGQWFDEI